MEKPFLHVIRKGCHRCLIVFLLLIIQLFGLSAQEQSSASSSKLNFGFRVGAAISSFTNQQPQNNIMAGFTGGAFVAYPINEKMEVQAEVFYTQEGGRLQTFSQPNLLGQYYWYSLRVDNQRIVLNMLNVPILYKYNLPLSGTKLSVFIGPNFGYLLDANSHKESTVFTETGSFHTFTETENVSSNMEKISYAAIAGIGTEISLGNYALVLDARYKYGFTPVYKSYSYVGIPQLSSNLKSHSVIISVGISF